MTCLHLTYEQNIYVSSDACSILQVGLIASQQQTQNGLLYVLMAMDTWSQRLAQLLKDILKHTNTLTLHNKHETDQSCISQKHHSKTIGTSLSLKELQPSLEYFS